MVALRLLYEERTRKSRSDRVGQQMGEIVKAKGYEHDKAVWG
jgi:hypothetical protein